MRWVFVLAVVCTGSTTTGDCATRDDCAADERCDGPNDPNVCGIPPLQDCERSADCGTAMACWAVFDTCSPDGLGSECRAPCDADCATGFACTDGGCLPIRCGGDGDCPAHQRCDAASVDPFGPVHAQTDGCVPVACTDNAGCGPLSCVNGVCQEGPGTCVEDVAVP